MLYGDGHVAWAQSPFAGAPIPGAAVAFNDNIYTASIDATGEGGQVSSSKLPYDPIDTFLLPTDDATGF